MLLPPLPLLRGTFIRIILHIGTIRFDGTITPSLHILLPIPLSKPPLLGGENLLTTRELELGTSQSLHCGGFLCVLTTNGHQGLADVDTCNSSLWFPVRSSHSCLEPISS